MATTCENCGYWQRIDKFYGYCGYQNAAEDGTIQKTAVNHYCTIREAEKSAVNHPAHYKQGNIETWDACDAIAAGKPTDQSNCVWQIAKYIARYNEKGGVEDLHKAGEYLARLIAKVEAGGAG